MRQEIFSILEELSKDTYISKEDLIKILENVSLIAARKKYGNTSKLKTIINRKTGEIEIYHGDFDNIIDKGEKFSFEKPSLIPACDEDYENLFDRDTLEQYCKEFGFDLFYDEPPDYYYILKNQKLGKTINEYAASYKKTKPWWKFW